MRRVGLMLMALTLSAGAVLAQSEGLELVEVEVKGGGAARLGRRGRQ